MQENTGQKIAYHISNRTGICHKIGYWCKSTIENGQCFGSLLRDVPSWLLGIFG